MREKKEEGEEGEEGYLGIHLHKPFCQTSLALTAYEENKINLRSHPSFLVTSQEMSSQRMVLTMGSGGEKKGKQTLDVYSVCQCLALDSQKRSSDYYYNAWIIAVGGNNS
eukprot:scaffold537_cov180-Ochromonas_danica.AAC.20